MTTYTVYTDTATIARGCTIEDAAVEILGYDGHRWEVRDTGETFEEEHFYAIFRSRFSTAYHGGDGGLAETTAGVYALNADAAWPLLAAQVIHMSHDWSGARAIPDEDYDETEE